MASSLGIYCAPGHDIGAALVIDGELVVRIEEERLNRFKYGVPRQTRWLWRETHGCFGYLPLASMTYCLRTAGLGLDDLDVVVFPEARGYDARRVLPLRDPDRILVMDPPVEGFHHLAHAFSTFFASPFEEAAVLIVDGDGSHRDGRYEAETGYHFPDRGGDYRRLFKNRYPRGKVLLGLGWMYEHISNLLGFNSSRTLLSEPGKTMGLAPYGSPRDDLGAPWVRHDGYRLDFSGFRNWVEEHGYVEMLNRFEALPNLYRENGEPRPLARDLAFQVQASIEEAMLHLVSELHRETRCKSLCLAGGLALNSVVNGRIARESPFEQIFVQPAAGDNGLAIGLAYYGYLKCLQSPPPLRPMRDTYGGKTYSTEEIDTAIQESGLEARSLGGTDAAAEEAARRLADGAIIGWFQGGSEYGPRALGHRSILADPRRAEAKDLLNQRVKFREAFRPFAPSALKERAAEVFELDRESPYMLFVAPVRPAWRGRVPAITHVDGSARVQTVDRAISPTYHALLSAFDALTGVPVLLNTSFNLRGTPIVESPQDTLQAFVLAGLDVLFLGDRLVEAPTAEQIQIRVSSGWRVERSPERKGHWVLHPSKASGRDIVELTTILADTGHEGEEALEIALHLLRSDARSSSLARLAKALECGTETDSPLPIIARQLARLGALEITVGDKER